MTSPVGSRWASEMVSVVHHMQTACDWTVLLLAPIKAWLSSIALGARYAANTFLKFLTFAP